MPEETIIKDYTLSRAWGCSVEGKWAMRQALPERVRPHVDQEVLDQWCEAPVRAARAGTHALISTPPATCEGSLAPCVCKKVLASLRVKKCWRRCVFCRVVCTSTSTSVRVPKN